jgi:hypothetical protein
MRHSLMVLLLLALSAIAPGLAAEAPQIPQFVGLTDGSTVTSPFTVRFRLSGAGSDTVSHQVMAGMSGMAGRRHVHLVIDAPLPSSGEAIPVDAKHRHLMHGERQVTLRLPPGDHTLQLVLAGSNHKVDNPPAASGKITVHVVGKPKPGTP